MRRWVVVTGIAVVVAVGAALGVWQWGSAPEAATSVRFGFEDGRQRWSPLWGEDKVTYQVTPAAAFEGKRSLQIGNEAALPTDTEWKEHVWTVPEVDKVQAIGLEIYQRTDNPVMIWIDAVNW